jgi:hypothetical protein
MTNAVYATRQPNAETYAQYGRPGTTWYAQVARWTTPFGTDVNEYAIEPGPIQFYLNNKLLPFTGQDDYQRTIGDLVQVISSVPGWTANLDYVQDPQTNEFVDPILVVAYTAGAQPMAGLQVAYPQDSKGQFGPHPAVEIFHNGSWRHGTPVNGNLQSLTPADYAFQTWNFPGGAASYDETGGTGPTGEASSTQTTRQNVAPTGPTYPTIVSTAGGLTLQSLATDLGLPASANGKSVSITMQDTYAASDASFFYNDTTTIEAVIADLNYYSFAYANLDDTGHLVLANIEPVATDSTAFQNVSGDAAIVFGSATVVPHHMYSFNNSLLLFTTSTALAPFAAKGILEIAVNIEGTPVSVGFISGKGAALSAGQHPLVTMGDLLDAINATPGAVAYLENGRLVVGVTNVLDNPILILAQRYIDAELYQGQPIAFHDASNLLFGATDYRNNASFNYEDQFVGIQALQTSFNRMLFAGAIPPQQTYAAFDPANASPAKLGTRMVNASDLLSTYYPIGYLMEPFNSVYNNRYQNSAIEVSATNTVGEMMNYVGGIGTLRFVEADGTHNSAGGYLRFTGLGVEIIWSNPATGDYGLATRFFTDTGEGNAAPTNKIV